MASDIVKGRTLPDLGWTTWNLLATTYWSLNLAGCLIAVTRCAAAMVLVLCLQGPPVFNPDALVRAIREILESQREDVEAGPLDDMTYFADSLRMSPQSLND